MEAMFMVEEVEERKERRATGCEGRDGGKKRRLTNPD